MQEVVDALKPQLSLELVLEDPLQVASSQRADAVFFGGSGIDPLLERFDLIRREARDTTGLLLGVEGFHAAVAVGVAPVLGEPTAAADGGGDVLLAVGFDGENGDAEAIALESFGLFGCEVAEAGEVARFTFGNVDVRAPGCGTSG